MRLLNLSGVLVNIDQVLLIEKVYFRRHGIRLVFASENRYTYFDSIEERDRVFNRIRNLYEIEF